MKGIALLVLLSTLSACKSLDTRLAENPQVVADPMMTREAMMDEMPVDMTDTVISYQ